MTHHAQRNERSLWIDSLRGIAILAVVLDHGLYLFPAFRNDALWRHMYFSIPWFVFLSGAANAASFQKKQITRLSLNGYVGYLRKRFGLLFPYLAASLVSYWLVHWPEGSWVQVGSEIVSFSAQPPYYYVNLILQLYLIFPLLFLLFSHIRAWWGRVLVLSLFPVVSQVLMMLPQPPWPFAPAGRLFGGLYLSVFALGIVIALGIRHKKETVVRETNAFHPLVLFSLACWLGLFLWLEWLMGATNGYFLGLVPTWPFVIWATSFAIVMKWLGDMAGWYDGVGKVLTWIGKRSVGIFLLHYAILTLFSRYFPDRFFLYILALFSAIVIPLVVSIGIERGTREILRFRRTF